MKSSMLEEPFQSLVRKEDLDSVKSQLKASTEIMNMCYLPLNANILCSMYGHLIGSPGVSIEVWELSCGETA